MILRVLVHARQELCAAPGWRRLGLPRQMTVFETLDSPRQRVLTLLDRRFQPAGTDTCASAERDRFRFGSPTCTCRLRAHAAYVHMCGLCADWATRTAVDLLKRVKELLQLGLPRREQLEPMLLAPRSFLEYRSRLCD